MRLRQPWDRLRSRPALDSLPLRGQRAVLGLMLACAILAGAGGAALGAAGTRTPSARMTASVPPPASAGTTTAAGTSTADTSTAATSTAATTSSAGAASPLRPTPPAARPNIVFVLTDDLSFNLLRFMPHVQALAHRGMSFRNYYVSDSLCCPSRASIFTGSFPHNTGVFTNVGADGGMTVFHNRGEEAQSFNVALQKAGYSTAMMGKYLNGYLEGVGRSGVSNTYVPPGWNEWDVAGFGYPEYDYPLNINGVVHHFGHRRHAYLTDVLARRGAAFVDRSAAAHNPFFLELATFAPHSPFTPAHRDARRFPGLRAPEPPSFDTLPANPPSWLAGHPPLTLHQIDHINRAYRLRARSVLAVDDLIARIEARLQVDGLMRNTYFVFSSDNGYHTGEHRLGPGKLTAFDTDIRVPLIVAGPGIRRGTVTNAMAQNIDLARTFTDVGGATLDTGDGHSLAPVLFGQPRPSWRNAALIEHHGPDLDSHDPDRQGVLSGNPTTYEAMRTYHYLYVEYANGEREFYDLRADPFELDNIAATLTPNQQLQLHDSLSRLENCQGASQCWAAAHVPPLP
ncbi:MAG TPA: sulfatase [Solirubrobacteraceae bacterium]|nr:sulfatase [Solirubrobacteraceae bacterium]